MIEQKLVPDQNESEKSNNSRKELQKKGVKIDNASLNVANCQSTISRFKQIFNCKLESREESSQTSRQIDRRKLKAKKAEDELVELKDVDSGYAWIILAVMFVINASTFGTARAYGLIFEKLARQDEQSRSQAALPFTIMGAIENMGGPLTGYILARTGSWRFTVFMGSCLITLSHLLASLCDSQVGQILTMGIMCGLGLSLITISSFQINNAYFVRYRSRAFGLGLTGAAFGTFYISPLCQYVLKNYTTNICYFMLGLILLPNVPLSLLLKQKKTVEEGNNEICSISGQVALNEEEQKNVGIWFSIKQVIKNPLFHLIWPTQLLFCWFNFVFGMIIVDFSKDRGLDCRQASHLIPIWALGQLVGRLALGSLVDFRFVSYRLFTVICFASISLATWLLNNVRIEQHEDILISLLVFILSMFISNLYILFNGLVVNYMDKSLTALSIGISSFAGSFFLLPRASIIGYYRDTIGNYDAMLNMFTYISMTAALVWLIMPKLCSQICSIWVNTRKSSTNTCLAKSLTLYTLSQSTFKHNIKSVASWIASLIRFLLFIRQTCRSRTFVMNKFSPHSCTNNLIYSFNFTTIDFGSQESF